MYQRAPKLRSGIASTSGVAIPNRQPPLAHAAIDLPTTPDDGGRKAIVGSFTTTHGSLRVVSLHLSHLRTPDATRLRTTQLFFALEAAQAGWAVELVVAGDFNALWTAPELVALRRVATAASAPSLAGQTSLIGTTGALIDHIALISPALPAASPTEIPAPTAILHFAEIALVLD